MGPPGHAWFDAHCHLPPGPEAQLPPGDGRWVLNGLHPGDWKSVAGHAAGDPRVIPSYGVHPWEVDRVPSDWSETLESLLQADPHAHVGETGLDRTRRGGDWELQQNLFHRHLELAVQYRRVVSIHAVRVVEALEEIAGSLPEMPAILLHAYSGPAERVAWWVEAGAFFSFNARHCASDRSTAAFRLIPESRLLVETDTEPRERWPDAVSALAALRGIPAAAMQAQVVENATHCFAC